MSANQVLGMMPTPAGCAASAASPSPGGSISVELKDSYWRQAVKNLAAAQMGAVDLFDTWDNVTGDAA